MPTYNLEDLNTWKYNYTNTLPPILTLLAVTSHILYWIGVAKTMVTKIAKNAGNKG